MERATSVKELNAVLVGSKSSRKYLVGNIILGREAFNHGDVKSCCERAEGEVCGRRVTLAKAPGWLRGYELCNTPELLKTEAILSVSPGLHCFILVINAEQSFKDVYQRATRQHLEHFFGDKVWDHTIVVFSHRGHLDQKDIEDYIKTEGAPLQSLLERCGNRHHLLSDNGTDSTEKVKELLEKIDAMVAENSGYEINSTLVQNAESKTGDVDRKAEELRLQSQQQRKTLRNLMTEPRLNLRILMVGWVFSGKSATGNSILGEESFQARERTVKALKQRGEVAGREVVIVDTPGWWKFFPATFTPAQLKSEILKGVSLCSPSPNVILLLMTADTAFTDEQRRITEENMRLLGQRAWRHVIVVFSFGDSLGDKTIEQYIESEGQALRWLIEKCGNRYHVLNNVSKADDQVTELLEKMEEMVAGNSSFYLGAHPDVDDPQPRVSTSDMLTIIKNEKALEKIVRQLLIEWDRKNWEHQQRYAESMGEPLTMSDVRPSSQSTEAEEEQMERHHADDQSTACVGPEVDSGDASGSLPVNRLSRLFEKEWSRREVVMEQAAWRHFYNPVYEVTSEPGTWQLQVSRDKVTRWLKTQNTSGFGTASNISFKTEDDVFGPPSSSPEDGGTAKIRRKSVKVDECN